MFSPKDRIKDSSFVFQTRIPYPIHSLRLLHIVSPFPNPFILNFNDFRCFSHSNLDWKGDNFDLSKFRRQLLQKYDIPD